MHVCPGSQLRLISESRKLRPLELTCARPFPGAARLGPSPTISSPGRSPSRLERSNRVDQILHALPRNQLAAESDHHDVLWPIVQAAQVLSRLFHDAALSEEEVVVHRIRGEELLAARDA